MKCQSSYYKLMSHKCWGAHVEECCQATFRGCQEFSPDHHLNVIKPGPAWLMNRKVFTHATSPWWPSSLISASVSEWTHKEQIPSDLSFIRASDACDLSWQRLRQVGPRGRRPSNNNGGPGSLTRKSDRYGYTGRSIAADLPGRLKLKFACFSQQIRQQLESDDELLVVRADRSVEQIPNAHPDRRT